MYFEVFGDREGCGPGEVRMGNRKSADVRVERLSGPDHPSQGEGSRRYRRCTNTAAAAADRACSTARSICTSSWKPNWPQFVHKEAAIIFGTGFQANYATLSALTEKGDVMICDHNLHASLVEGALRSPARTVRFRHNDLEHFERCLENCPPEEKILIVSEGVFSMEGDIADLRGIVEAGQAVRRAHLRGRSARHRRAGRNRRGRGRASGRAGRCRYRHGHVQQIAGVGGRLHRRRKAGDRLS